MNKKILLILLFALFIAVFSIQNASPVLIRLFVWDFNISLVLIVLGAIVFGAILMTLVTSLSSLRLNKEIKMEKREKEELLAELEEMKRNYQDLLAKSGDYDSDSTAGNNETSDNTEDRDASTEEE
ncbi:MAG TPA: LapA family protein [Halanaerobiaceae bacterium]|nr:LapA family protein [Bacillota bacterium]HHU91964.1 LapA family protein [Halanaerobiaceae bacterium]HOA40858.1 LapA family protein [Halanaerobiales bacterium]HPZ62967.1 LapA family protein [Halanaerobiales bacterium]HQD04128.1 LapA family protein [Halanaerobiales bacterium]